MTGFRDNRTAARATDESDAVGGSDAVGTVDDAGSGDGASTGGGARTTASPDGGTVVRGDRFAGGPARGFLSSLAADERIFEADLAVDRAHVVMLAEQGVLDATDAGHVLQALNVVEVEEHGGLPAGEDVHEAIESKVVAIAGDVGGKMHTARSRNDEVATCIRYRLREDVLDAVDAVNDVRAALLSVAEAHAETLMPGYTHLQSAQPTTVGHWALSYAGAFARDAERLLSAYDRVNRSALGAAAFAGTPFDVDRERTAELLGFDGLVTNATDAVAARDHLVEVASGLATVATHLSGVSEDLVVFANRGFVDLDDAYASTSSIMPQKKNPDGVELVRATAGDAASSLAGLLTTLKGLPRAYNRDLQSATPHVWRAVDTVTAATGVAAGAVATADWPAETLAAAAGEGFATATAVADALAMAGVPFRTAHEVVATASERADGDAPAVETIAAAVEELLDASLDEFVDPETVAAALDPAADVAMRDSVGGPAPEAVAADVSSATESLSADETTVAAQRDSLSTAHESLQEAVSAYV